DIAIEFTGLRPGEKLYEELLIGDNVSATEHPMIMRADEEYFTWDVLKGLLARLLKAVEADDYPQVRVLLCEAVCGYVPEGSVVDLIYQHRRVGLWEMCVVSSGISPEGFGMACHQIDGVPDYAMKFLDN